MTRAGGGLTSFRRRLPGQFRHPAEVTQLVRVDHAADGLHHADRDGRVVNVFALDIADGEVQAIRCVVNPDKLRHLGRVSELARERMATPRTD